MNNAENTKKPAGQPLAPTQEKPAETELDKLRKEIDETQKKRSMLVFDTNRLRHRLAYKKEEYEAVRKLVDLNTDRGKNAGRLRRMKEELEFRISTETATVNQEKELLKKLGSIQNELEEANKFYRLRKKTELVEKDIVGLSKVVDEQSVKIKEIDKTLDALFDRLRKSTGGARQHAHVEHEKKINVKKPFEISLEDIAVIKKTGNKDKVNRDNE